MNILIAIADAPSGRGFIIMVRQRQRIFQVHGFLIYASKPQTILWQTKYAMVLTECAHQGLPRGRGFIFSFVVQKEF